MTPEERARAEQERRDRANLFTEAARRRQAGQLATRLSDVRPLNPDTVGKAFEMAAEVGVNPYTLAHDPKFIDNFQKQRDTIALLERSPGLRKWVDVPEYAALSHDELDKLAAYDNLAKSADKPAFTRGLESGWIGGKAITGGVWTTSAINSMNALENTFAVYGNYEQIEAGASPAELAAYKAADPVFKQYVEMTPEQRVAHKKTLADELLRREGVAQDFYRSVVAYQLQMQQIQGEEFTWDNFGSWAAFQFGNAAPFLGAAIASGAVGGTPALVAFGAVLGQGEITSDAIGEGYTLEDLQDDDFVARRNLGTVAYAATELLGPAARLTRGSPLGMMIRKPFAKIPRDKLIRAAEGYLGRTLKDAGAGAIEEGINELLQQMISEWAVHGELEWTDEAVAARIEAFAAGALVGGGTTTVIEAPGRAARLRKEREAVEAQNARLSIEEINKAVADTAMPKRSPKAFRKFLQNGGFDQRSMYVDGAVLAEQAKKTPEILQSLGIGKAALDRAVEGGNKVSINLARYMETVPGTPLQDFFAEHGSLKADRMSFSEAVEYLGQEKAARAAEEARGVDTARKVEEARRQVVQAVASQLRAAGVKSTEGAELWGAFFTTLAKRSGLPIEELTRRLGVQIMGPGTTQQQRVEMETRDLEQEIAAEQDAFEAQLVQADEPPALTDDQRRELESGALPRGIDSGAFLFATPDSQRVPLDKIRPIRARPEGTANARPLMAKAALAGSRRQPLSVRQEADGTYTLLDGNSTYAVLSELGVADAPVRVFTDAEFEIEQIEDAIRKILEKPGKKARYINAARLRAADPDRWDSAWELLRETTQSVFPTFEEMVDTPDAAKEQDALYKVLGEALDDLGIPYKNPGPKKKARAREKVEEKYRGDHRLLGDTVRAGFAPQTLDQVDAVLARLRKVYTVVDEGFAFTPAGYFDRKVSVLLPSGRWAELQVWPPGMLQAKENGGQAAYDVWRVKTNPQADRDAALVTMLDLYSAVVSELDASWAPVVLPAMRKNEALASRIPLTAAINSASVISGERMSDSTASALTGQEPDPANMVAEPSSLMETTPGSERNQRVIQDTPSPIAGEGTVSGADTTRNLFQSGIPLFDNPLKIDGKVTVRAIGEAMTADHMEKHGRKFYPEDDEADYQQVLETAAEEMAVQLQRLGSGVGWYSKDVELAISETAKVYPEIATPEGRAVWLTFAGIFSNGLDPSQAWEISAEAFEYWVRFGEIPINRAEAAARLGNEVKMTSFKDNKTGEQITRPAGWGVRNPANEQQLLMFKNLVEREGGPVQAVEWMLSEQTPDAINEIVLTAQNTPRFKTKAEREGPKQWGALMFSEKLGRYTMGLHGFQISEDDTTVDLWYTRTYRRLTGRLLDKPIGKEGVAAQPDPARGGIERKTIFRMTGDLSRMFGDIPPGDVQAVLWFFEKRLWGAQGLRTDEGTNSAGARRLLEKRGVAFDDGEGSAAQDQGAGQKPAATRDLFQRAQNLRRSDGGRATIGGRDVSVAAVFGEGTPRPVYELSNPEDFTQFISAAKDALGPVGAQVTLYDSYAGIRTFVFDDGAAGFAINDGDIISVFADPARAEPGVAERALALAVAEGGNRLDAFDTFLPRLYAKNGFRAVARLAFNRDYAPEGWDYGFFTEQFPDTGGEPDVVFMVYDPANATPVTDNEVSEYDDGIAAQQAALAREFDQAARADLSQTKVVDRNGKPLLVRHGTTARFERPRAFTQFTPDPWISNHFGPDNGGRVIEAYLDIRNPADLRAMNISPSDPNLPQILRDLQAQGYDGAFYRDSSFIPFSEDQIVVVNDSATLFQTEARADLSQTSAALPANPFPESEVQTTVFHRTSEDFDRFRLGTDEQSGPAIWFGRDPENLQQLHNRKREGDRIIPAFVDIRAPLMLDEFNLREMQDRWAGGSKEFPFYLPTEVVERLREAGFDGIIAEDIYGDGKVDEVVVFNEGQVRSAIDPSVTLFQTEARGVIRIPMGGVLDGNTVIELFKSADASTFLHESGHFFLEAFQAIAQLPEAPQAMKDEMAAINVALGRAPDDTSTFTTEQQEQWAEWFETYLMNGTAPSPTLKAAFSKFATWLVELFKRGRIMGIQPPAEVKEIFDRLLATDEELETARVQHDAQAMFADIETPPGMTQEEYETYKKVADRAEAEAKGRLLERTMAKIRRRRTAEYKARRKQIEQETRDALRGQQVYTLIDRLGNGGVDLDSRLDQDQLVEMFGEDVLKDLSARAKGTKTSLYNKGGQDIEVVADFLGYPDAASMVNDLRSAKPFEEAVAAEIDTRLEDELGNPDDEVSIQEEAEAAIKNGLQTEVVAREAAALARAAGGTRGGPTRWQAQNAAAKAEAERRVQDMEVREVLGYRAFLRASQKAAREAQTQLAKVVRNAEGQPVAGRSTEALAAAVKAKRAQLLNDHMYRIARERARKYEAARKRFARFSKLSVKKAIGADFMDVIQTMLDQYNFRVLPIKEVKRAASLQEMYQRLLEENRGSEMAIPLDVIARVEERHYTQLKARELDNVIMAIDNLAHMGRATTKAIAADEAFDLLVAMDAIEERADKNLKDRPVERESAERSGWRDFGRQFVLHVLNADSILRDIDGDETALGPAYNTIKKAIDRGVAAADARRQKAARDIHALYGKAFGTETRTRDGSIVYKGVNKAVAKLRKSKRVYEGIRNDGKPETLTRLGLISMALNAGNRDNWERLTNPDGKATYNAEALQRLLVAELTEREWRFVQDVWDYLDSYWPEVAAQERKYTGVAPKKVAHQMMIEGAPEFVTGGYYPIRYDNQLSSRQDDLERAKLATEGTVGIFGKAMTSHGHTEERLKSTGKPLELDLGIIDNHVYNVIHDLELRGPVRDAARIVYSERFGEMLTNKGRTEDVKALKAWLQDVAAGDKALAYGMERWFRWMRGGFTLSAIGFKISTIMIQPLGLTQSMVQVGYGAMTRGYASYLRQGPYSMHKFAVERSAIMQERIRTFDRDISQLTGELAAGAATQRGYQRVINSYLPWAYAGMQYMQYWVVDLPTWVASYEKSIREGKKPSEAVTIADRDVRVAQGSGLMSDRGMLERGRISPVGTPGELARLFTVLGSYMFSKFNLAYRRARGTDFSNPAAIAKLSMDFAMLFVVEATLVYLLRNGWPDEEDDEPPLPLIAAREGLYTAMGTMPVFREVAGGLQGFGGASAYGEYTGAAAGLLESGGRIARGVVEGDLESVTDRRVVEGLLGFGGTAFFLPSGQLNAMLDAVFTRDWEVEDDAVANFLESITGLPVGGEDES